MAEPVMDVLEEIEHVEGFEDEESDFEYDSGLEEDCSSDLKIESVKKVNSDHFMRNYSHTSKLCATQVYYRVLDKNACPSCYWDIAAGLEDGIAYIDDRILQHKTGTVKELSENFCLYCGTCSTSLFLFTISTDCFVCRNTSFTNPVHLEPEEQPPMDLEENLDFLPNA